MTAEHKPNPKDRAMVRKMSSFGIPQEEIAEVLEIDSKTLRKHYRKELNTAAAIANTEVAESLFNKATGDGPGSVPAAIFWLKSRAGWREKQELDVTSSDGSMTPAKLDLSKLSTETLAEIVAAKDAAAND